MRLGLVLVVALALVCAGNVVEAAKFGAAGHQSAEFIALGELPEFMAQCPALNDDEDSNVFSDDSLFSESDRLAIYFGNWMRDYSQIIDPADVPCLPGQTTEDCLGRKDKLGGIVSHLTKASNKIASWTKEEEDDNFLQKKLKSMLANSAGKFFDDISGAAEFLNLAFENRISRKTLTRVGMVLWQSKMEKLFEGADGKYADLLKTDDAKTAPLFVKRNVKGADGQDWAIGKFAVDPDEFGVYVLEEHIDNPDEYPQANDKDLDFDPGCNNITKTVDGTEIGAGCSRVSIDPLINMKRYFDDSLNYFASEMQQVVFCGRSEQLARKEKRWKDADLWKHEKLRHFGQGLHTVEDFFAHTNWMELLIRRIIEEKVEETGDESILRFRPTPWTASYEGVYPVITGKFSSTDILGSMLGILDDRAHHKEHESVGDKLSKLLPETCVASRTEPLLMVEKLGMLIGADLMQEMAKTKEEKEAAADADQALGDAVGPWFDGLGLTSDHPPEPKEEATAKEKAGLKEDLDNIVTSIMSTTGNAEEKKEPRSVLDMAEKPWASDKEKEKTEDNESLLELSNGQALGRRRAPKLGQTGKRLVQARRAMQRARQKEEPEEEANNEEEESDNNNDEEEDPDENVPEEPDADELPAPEPESESKRKKGRTQKANEKIAANPEGTAEDTLAAWRPAMKAYCVLSSVSKSAKIFLEKAAKLVKAMAKPIKALVPTLRDVSGWLGFAQNWAHLIMWVQEGSNYGAAAEALKFYQWANAEWLPEEGKPGEENAHQRKETLDKFKKDEGWDAIKTISLEFSNPTHTQIAKDKEHHVIHKLSKKVAEYVVRLLGEEFVRQEKNGWKEDEGNVKAPTKLFRFDRDSPDLAAAGAFLQTSSSTTDFPFLLNLPGMTDFAPSSSENTEMGAPGLKGKKARTVGPGSTGWDVQELQRLLTAHKDLGVDLLDEQGFGEKTERAVRKFQSLHGIPSTGVVNAHTWLYLYEKRPVEMHEYMHSFKPREQMGPFLSIAAQLFRHPKDFKFDDEDKNLQCVYNLVKDWTERQLQGEEAVVKGKSVYAENDHGALEILSAYDVQSHQNMESWLDKLGAGVEEIWDRTKAFADSLNIIGAASDAARAVKQKASKTISRLFDPSKMAIETASKPCTEFVNKPTDQLVENVYKLLKEDWKGLPEKMQDWYFGSKKKEDDTAFMKAFGLQRVFQCIAVRIQDRQLAEIKMRALLLGLAWTVRPKGKGKGAKAQELTALRKAKNHLFALSDGTRPVRNFEAYKNKEAVRKATLSGLRFLADEFPENNDAQTFFKSEVLTWIYNLVGKLDDNGGITGWSAHTYELVHRLPGYKCPDFVKMPLDRQAAFLRLVSRKGSKEKYAKAFQYMLGCYEEDCEKIAEVLKIISPTEKPVDGAHMLLDSIDDSAPSSDTLEDSALRSSAAVMLKCGFLERRWIKEEVVDRFVINQGKDVTCDMIRSWNRGVLFKVLQHEIGEFDRDGALTSQMIACCVDWNAEQTAQLKRIDISSLSKLKKNIEDKWEFAISTATSGQGLISSAKIRAKSFFGMDKVNKAQRAYIEEQMARLDDVLDGKVKKADRDAVCQTQHSEQWDYVQTQGKQD